MCEENSCGTDWDMLKGSWRVLLPKSGFTNSIVGK